jgi:hypothetical protein
MKRLLLVAVALVAVFGLLHLAGLREDAGILSGSPASSVLGGIAYVLAYFGAVVVAPIFLLAEGLLALHRRRGR